MVFIHFSAGTNRIISTQITERQKFTEKETFHIFMIYIININLSIKLLSNDFDFLTVRYSKLLKLKKQMKQKL